MVLARLVVNWLRDRAVCLVMAEAEMSGSSWQGKREIEEFLVKNHGEIFDLLDIGPGRGVYGLMAKWAGILRCTAVEIFPDYAQTYNYKYIYDQVIFGDFTRIDLPSADCIVFGDVLEHVEKARAVGVVEKARKRYRHIIVSLPIGPWPQGPSEGNVHETHVATWSFQEAADGICRDFPFQQFFKETNTGVFIR